MFGNHENELSYAVRWLVVLKYVGQLGLVVSALISVPAVVAAATGDTGVALRYGAVIAVLVVGSALLARLSAPANLQTNEALAIVAIAFALTSAAMTYPLMGADLPLVDAFFESVSGVTTTGLTTTATVADKPASFLFARAWLQWFGGLGIVVLWVALATRPGAPSKALSGVSPPEDDLIGGTKARSRRVLAVYSALTVLGVGALLLAGVPPFVALLHTLAAISTGGFSNYDQSLAALPNRAAVAVVIVVCVAGALPTMAYYRAWRREAWEPLRDRQLWALLVLGLVAGGVLAPLVAGSTGITGFGAVGQGMAMSFMAQTTSGFSTIDPARLGPAAKLVLIFAMLVGGSAGSTAGGLKLIRLLVLLRFLQAFLLRTSLPRHAVHHPRLAGHRLDLEELREVAVYLLMGLLVLGASWFAFLLGGYDPLDSLFDVVSATGTVGLSSGVTGPGLATPLKAVLCADMLMGRLEIAALFVLFYPRTWIGTRRKQS